MLPFRLAVDQQNGARTFVSGPLRPLLISDAGAYLPRMCGRFDNLIARDAYRGLFKAQRLPKSNFPSAIT